MLVQGANEKKTDRELLCVITCWHKKMSRCTIVTVLLCSTEAGKNIYIFLAYKRTNDVDDDSSSSEVLVWFTYQ